METRERACHKYHRKKMRDEIYTFYIMIFNKFNPKKQGKPREVYGTRELKTKN